MLIIFYWSKLSDRVYNKKGDHGSNLHLPQSGDGST